VSDSIDVTMKLQLLSEFIEASLYAISETSCQQSQDRYELLIRARKYALCIGLLFDPLELFDDYERYCIAEYMKWNNKGE
jgi:hypothetical protein